MQHHRRHPLIDRIRDMLDRMEGRRLFEPPRADFHTDQMPMAPPYRGPDPGRASIGLRQEQEKNRLYVLVATAVYDQGVVGVYTNEEGARQAAEEIWPQTDGHHSFRIDVVEPDKTYENVFEYDVYNWDEKTKAEYRGRALSNTLRSLIEVDDRTIDSSSSAETPRND